MSSPFSGMYETGKSLPNGTVFRIIHTAFDHETGDLYGLLGPGMPFGWVKLKSTNGISLCQPKRSIRYTTDVASTPWFFAPETLKRTGPIDDRFLTFASDIWSQ